MTPEAAIGEIRDLLASTEEEEEAAALVQAIIDQVDGGAMDPADGIEEIEHLISEGEDEHKGHGHGARGPALLVRPPPGEASG